MEHGSEITGQKFISDHLLKIKSSKLEIPVDNLFRSTLIVSSFYLQFYQKILNILRLSNTLIDLVLQTLADCL